MEQRTHPYTIFVNLWRVFYLAILPVIRGFITAIQGDFSAWLSGAWFDILVFLFMITISTLRWWLQRYSCTEEGIRFRTGFIVRESTFIRWDCVSSFSLTSPYLLKPLKACFLRVDTPGGSYKDSDIHMYLNRRQAMQIEDTYRAHDMAGSESHLRHYRPPLSSILAMGILDSNSLAGIIFIATFISQSGRLLGKEFSNMIMGTFENLTRTLALGIPPAAAAIAYIIIAGWFIGLARTMLRYSNFYIVRREQNIAISGGRFTSRDYLVDYPHVYFIDIRQTLGTKALGLYSMYMSAIGYGKRKDDITCVLLPAKDTLFDEYRRLFFPSFVPCSRQLTPLPGGFFRFLSQPLMFCVGLPLLMTILIHFIVPSWKEFILFVGLMSLLPSFLFLAVRWIDFRTSGIGRNGDYYTLRYSSGLQLHVVVVSADNIIKIELRQSFFQHFSKSCDVYIYTPAEVRTVHRCRNIDLVQAQAFFDEY